MAHLTGVVHCLDDFLSFSLCIYVRVCAHVYRCLGRPEEGEMLYSCIWELPELGAGSVAEALSTHSYTSSLARLFHLGSHFVMKLSS